MNDDEKALALHRASHPELPVLADGIADWCAAQLALPVSAEHPVRYDPKPSSWGQSYIEGLQRFANIRLGIPWNEEAAPAAPKDPTLGRLILVIGPSEHELRSILRVTKLDFMRPQFRFCREIGDFAGRRDFLAFVYGERRWGHDYRRTDAWAFLGERVKHGYGQWLEDVLPEGHPLWAFIKEARR